MKLNVVAGHEVECGGYDGSGDCGDSVFANVVGVLIRMMRGLGLGEGGERIFKSWVESEDETLIGRMEG